jgi:hypothetical protein
MSMEKILEVTEREPTFGDQLVLQAERIAS